MVGEPMCLSVTRRSGSPARTPRGLPGSRSTSPRTPCATATRLTCLKQGWTCAPSRCSSAMLRSITPPSISTSPGGIWMRSLTRSVPSRSQPLPRAAETGGSGRDESDRPILEVADIVRAAGNSFWERYGSRLAWPHRKVLDAIVRCRTKALGGHLDQCVRCGHQAISFNSCRNRHCPKCQGNARARWLAARSAELLPVPYFHIVFTLPHEFSALILQNKSLLYDLLFRTSAATLLEAARDPKYLGAE